MSVCPNQELVERCVKRDFSADDKRNIGSHFTECRGCRRGIESIHSNMLAGCIIGPEGLTVSPIATTIMTMKTGVDT
jgi:hypothetical protein